MSGRIYFLEENKDLVSLNETQYDSEKLLQELLANYPDLLAGEQINKEAPRRWLLVSREFSVPSDDSGAGRWSLDHLFLDQDAVPTLVEVKRSTDTRIRREVVGQMLDYASNAVAHWSVDDIRAKLEKRCAESDDDVSEVVEALLLEERSSDEFWKDVKTNLQAGRIRLVFVADMIPTELSRIVEFLNEQMDPAEIIAVEIRQFTGKGMKTLVPRVLGQTETAKTRKGAGGSRKKAWTEQLILETLEATKGDAYRSSLEQLLSWIRPKVSRIWVGTGSKHGGLIPCVDIGDKSHYVCRIGTEGWVAFRFDWLKSKPPFDSEALRRELLNRLNELPDTNFADDLITKRARIRLDRIHDPKVMRQIKNVMSWIIDRFNNVAQE